MSISDTFFFLLYGLGAAYCGILYKGRLQTAALVCLASSVFIAFAAINFEPMRYAYTLLPLSALQVASRCWSARLSRAAALFAAGFAWAAFFIFRSAGAPELVAAIQALPMAGVIACIYAAVKLDWRAAPLFSADCVESLVGCAAAAGLTTFAMAGEVGFAVAFTPWTFLLGLGLFSPAGARRLESVLDGAVAGPKIQRARQR